MRPKKLLYIFGTRPETIKLAPLILETKKDSAIVTKICNTGQHKELTDSALKVFGLSADYDHAVMTKNQELPRLTSLLIENISETIILEKPDLVIVQGDTSTAFSGAMAAFYNKIPIAHIEAGLRTIDKMNPFPEEINRRLISQLADLHFCPTVENKLCLESQSIAGPKYVTGNTGIDALVLVSQMIKSQNLIPNTKVEKLNKLSNLLLITIHRRENLGEHLENILSALTELISKYENTNFLMLLHPNPKFKRVIKEKLEGHRIQLMDPLDYTSMVSLLNKVNLLITDSGGLQEEAAFLGLPTIVLRKTTERQEAIEEELNLLISPNKLDVITAVSKVLDDTKVKQKLSRKSTIYGDGQASSKILSHIKKFLLSN